MSTSKERRRSATVARGSGIRGRDAGKARAHDHQESKEINEAVYVNQKTERSGTGNTIPRQALRRNGFNSVAVQR